MSASIIFVQLDSLPSGVAGILGNPTKALISALDVPLPDIEILCVNRNTLLPCTRHEPVIIVAGHWDNGAYHSLPSRFFKWLQEARRNHCPIFGFGFAHLALNSALGGVNLQAQRPGLKTVYKATGTNDFLTAVVPDRFNGWSICTMKTCTPPKSATILAASQQKEPMLIKFDERTYSTPLSLSLGWSGMVMWLFTHPEFLQNNEQILEKKCSANPGLAFLVCFLKIWGAYPGAH